MNRVVWSEDYSMPYVAPIWPRKGVLLYTSLDITRQVLIIARSCELPDMHHKNGFWRTGLRNVNISCGLKLSAISPHAYADTDFTE